MRRLVRSLVPTLAAALVAAGCVWPLPAPGEPVPTIATSSTWSPTSDTVTMEIEATDLSPTTARAWLPTLGGGVLVDDAAPFAVTLEVAGLPVGDHDVWVSVTDGTTWVLERETFTVHGCNGHLELCDRPYDQVRNVTTHNAMSSSTDGWTGPNHHLDVPGQLAAGVRGLMLDTYRAGDLNGIGLPQVPDADPDAPYLCHTFCALGQQELVEGLDEIRTFLDDEPGAVVTLIIESYLNHDLTAGAFVEAGLVDRTYVHNGGEWPTLGELLDAGRQLLVFQDRSVDPDHPWLMHVWTHAFETHFSAAAPADFSCDHLRGTPANDLFILNHFLTNVFGSPDLAAQVNGNPFLLDRALECEAFHDRAANFVTVDFTSIGDVHAAVATLNGLTP